VGIDVGSSAVKAAAYSDAGQLLAAASGAITPLYPAPGQWETDPLDAWRATSQAMQELGAQDALRRDPVRAIAISASGRENFPADAAGIPLGNGLMGADVRGEEFEALPPNQSAPESWCCAAVICASGWTRCFAFGGRNTARKSWTKRSISWLD
jgi:sugar (pentulose or hexulose) kinase